MASRWKPLVVVLAAAATDRRIRRREPAAAASSSRRSSRTTACPARRRTRVSSTPGGSALRTDDAVVGLRQRHGRLDPLQRQRRRYEDRPDGHRRRQPDRARLQHTRPDRPDGVRPEGRRRKGVAVPVRQRGGHDHRLEPVARSPPPRWRSTEPRREPSSRGSRSHRPPQGRASTRPTSTTGGSTSSTGAGSRSTGPSSSSTRRSRPTTRRSGSRRSATASSSRTRRRSRRATTRSTAQGFGFVDSFDAATGILDGKVAIRGALNAPWGIAQAPDGFGTLGGDILIGNFGDGHVNAYKPILGGLLYLPAGPLRDSSGAPIWIDGLWALEFGNGAAAGPDRHVVLHRGAGRREQRPLRDDHPVSVTGA